MEAVELQQISRAMSEAVGETSQEFREASRNNNFILSRVTKDIASVFAEQRADIASLTNSIEESMSNEQQTAFRIERMSMILQEAIGYMANMVGELKTVSGSIQSLIEVDEMIIRTLYNQGQGVTGALTSMPQSIWSLFSTGLPSILTSLGVGAAAGYIANQAMSGGSGGGGGGGAVNVPEGKGSGYEASGLSRPQIADMIRESAKKHGIDPEIAVRVAQSEGLNVYRSSSSGAKWGMDREPSYGPYQLLMGKGTSGPHGMGDDFYAATGINPSTDRSATSIQKQIDFALEHASKHGWGKWYGAKRVGISKMQGIGVSTPTADRNSGATPKSIADTTTPSGATPKSSPMQSETAKADAASHSEGGTGHAHPGIISGAAGTHENSAQLPSNDIVALGKTLEKMGMRISEHPAFGGVHHVHAKNSAHYRNEALDVNIGEGNIEANDPVMGKKFDELAAQLRASGYKVIWRAPGHENHLHVQLGKGESTPDIYAKRGSLTTNDAQQSGGSPTTPKPESPESSGTTPVSQAPTFQSEAAAGYNMMMGLAGGMGMGGGMGMMGSMSGFMTNISGLLAGLAATSQGGGITPEQTQNMFGQMLQPNLNNQEANEIIKNTEIEKTVAVNNASNPDNGPDNPPQVVTAPNAQSPITQGYDYNHPSNPNSREVSTQWSERFVLPFKDFPIKFWA